jgi:thiol-disulfide isomerase/thioredoxin
MIRLIRALVVLCIASASLAAQRPPKLGQAAPEFRLKLLSGGEASLSQFKGHPILVNFWATWCKPCRQEMPEIIAAYQAHRAQHLEILAVNLSDQDKMKDVRKFVAEMVLPFPVLLDEKGKTRERYRLITVPTSIFIDTEGMVRKINAGPISASVLQEDIAEILPR